MIVQGSVSLRITDDLPRELAMCSDGSRADDACRLQRPIFPGVLLYCAETPCAAMGFDFEPGRAMAITAPIFLRRATLDIESDWTRHLVREMLSEADRRHVRMVRLVSPESKSNAPDPLPELLMEARFTIRAGIALWAKAITFERGSDWTSRQVCSSSPLIDFEKLAGDARELTVIQRELILRLLHEILPDTQDLCQLPSPNADELLNEWIDQQATIAVGRQRGQELALCVFGQEFHDVDPTPLAFRIQYLGVIQQQRRMGIAAAFVNNLPRLLSATNDSGAVHNARLTAFADTANQPAAQLYRTCGFRIDSRLDVWCYDVGTQ